MNSSSQFEENATDVLPTPTEQNPAVVGFPSAQKGSGSIKRGNAIRAGLALVVLSAALGGGITHGVVSDNSAPLAASIESASVASDASTTQLTSVADLYDQVRPSVVMISSIDARGLEGIGSGVIVDESGLIVTNNHVVAGAQSLEVKFSTGETVSASVVETDSVDNVALVRVDGVDDLEAAVLGESDSLRIGDAVIAVGNPFGLEGTVTFGIVSATGRTIEATRTSAGLANLIQFDAAVNSGNSGGGLFDLQGHLVGIPTAIENPTGSGVFIGISLAVPVDTAEQNLGALTGL